MIEMDASRMGFDQPPPPVSRFRSNLGDDAAGLEAGGFKYAVTLVTPSAFSPQVAAADGGGSPSRGPPPAAAGTATPAAPPPPPAWQAAADAVLDSARELGAGALRAALQILYRYVEDYLGTSAGEEMVAAMRSAAQIGVPVLLGDLPSKVTFKRISQEVGSADMQKLEEEVSMAAPELRMGALDTKADLQALLEGGRDQATTRRIRKAFKNSAPGLFSALVDERDEYMARNLLTGLRAGRRRIVAVVGSIHVPGIEERLVRLGGLRAVDACVSA